MATGKLIDEEPAKAFEHALAARRLASRIAAVREAVGLAAYHAEEWSTAIAELRTYHRMSGRQTHIAVLADCERALGRPEKAIDLFRAAERDKLGRAEALELLIVAAGARGDMGQHDAAAAMLQIRELAVDSDEPWAARLRYAYADALLEAGRAEEAREWFGKAAAVDAEGITDAAERLMEMDGIEIEDDEDEDEESDVDVEDSDDDLEDDDDDESDDDESDDESDVDADDDDLEDEDVELEHEKEKFEDEGGSGEVTAEPDTETPDTGPKAETER